MSVKIQKIPDGGWKSDTEFRHKVQRRSEKRTPWGMGRRLVKKAVHGQRTQLNG